MFFDHLWSFKDMLILPRMLNPGVITTRQAITPAGVQSVFNGQNRYRPLRRSDKR